MFIRPIINNIRLTKKRKENHEKETIDKGYQENTYGNIAWQGAYEEIDFSIKSLNLLLLQNIRYIFTPFSINNIFLFILTIENFVFLLILGILLYELNLKRKKIIDVMILYIITSNFFSILVFNVGSIYRYRFPLIFSYILITYWLIKKNNSKKITKVIK